MTDSETIDINRILEILPHRYPFLLVDRVIEFNLGVSLKAIKNVSFNEPCFMGHFPGLPVFPGVLILEAMAQAAAIHASESLSDRPEGEVIFLFAGADNARFKRPVVPGDQLVLEVEQTRHKGKIWKYTVKASVDNAVAAVADIIFTYRLKQ